MEELEKYKKLINQTLENLEKVKDPDDFYKLVITYIIAINFQI